MRRRKPPCSARQQHPARVGWLLVVSLLGLAACNTQPPARVISIEDLLMPAEVFDAGLRYQEKSLVRRSEAAPDSAEGELLLNRSLASQRILGSAYWRYWIPDQDGERGMYKVKTTLYESPEVVAEVWARRYAPPALNGTEPLEMGDVGFHLPGRMIGFRQGAVMVEVSAHGAADQLLPFAEAYQDFVDGVLN